MLPIGSLLRQPRSHATHLCTGNGSWGSASSTASAWGIATSADRVAVRLGRTRPSPSALWSEQQGVVGWSTDASAGASTNAAEVVWGWGVCAPARVGEVLQTVLGSEVSQLASGAPR